MNKRIGLDQLKAFCKAALEKNGMSAEDARIVAEVLSETDALGVSSHGTKNLLLYIEKAVKYHTLDMKAIPEFVLEGPAFAVLDAHHAFGMVAGYKAMQKAMQLAKQSGIALVTVRNSCHFGAAGYYANMAAANDMIGIAMGNTDPNTAVPGGKGMTIGNSPFAYAVPMQGAQPISLDIAMSATAALKINQAKAEGKSIPDSWLIDDEGIPTTNPGYYQNGGALQAMAGHKGYGLSIMVDMISGLLSDGAVCADIPSWCFVMEEENKASHAFIAIDIAHFVAPQRFKDRARDYAEYIRNSPKAKGSANIYMPGEIEWGRRARAQEAGVTLPGDVADSLTALSASTGIAIDWIE